MREKVKILTFWQWVGFWGVLGLILVWLQVLHWAASNIFSFLRGCGGQ